MRPIDADAMREEWLENGENEYVYDTNAVLDSIDCQPTLTADDYFDAVDRIKPCPNCRYTLLGALTEDEPRWIPVTERYPDVCGLPVLLVAVNKFGQRQVVKGFTDYNCPVDFLTNEKQFDCCWHMWKVTHWMPLPTPPKEN